MSDRATEGFDSPYSRRYVLYAIALVFGVSVFNVVDRFVLSILVPGIQTDLALTDTQIGLLLGPSFSTVHFLMVLPAAWLADRFARRSVIAAGLFVWSAMTAFGGLAGNFTQIFLARMGVGVGEAAGSPPSAGLLSDTAPVEWRTRALSAITIGALAGMAVGMLVGGYLGQTYGWRFALIALGLPGIALAVLVRFTLREPARGAGPSVSPLAAARQLFRHASFRWSVVAVCIANVGICARNLWEPTFLARTYGLSMSEVGGAYLLVSALPSAIGALVGASVADRLGARDPRWLAWVCLVSLVSATPFAMAFLLWPETDVVAIGGFDVPVAFGWSVIASLLMGGFSPAMATLAQAVATPRMRSLAHAIWTMPFTLIGMGVGPFVVGVLSERWASSEGDDSLRYAILSMTVLIAVGGLAFAMAARSMREDLATVEAAETPEA